VEDFDMRRNFLIWMAGFAAALFLCGRFANPMPATAAQNPGPATTSALEAVPDGTHFLVQLDQELGTGKDKVNRKFDVRTIEPLQTSAGNIVPPGSKIHGHISRIEPGSVTGRARLWLTFDEIDTKQGRLPIVAEVSSVPGDFSVKPGESKEGEIEARTSTGTRDLEAAAAGAALGASAAGTATHSGKAAAIGAASGAAAGFLVSSGLGQELDLPKGSKLDLVLDRPLYINP
jgi:hypothetical protein